MPELKADIDLAKEIAEQAVRMLGGAYVSGMVYLGDRMGLYRSMNGAGLLTAHDLAAKVGIHERWIREWLQGQAAAGLIDYKGEGRFELSREAAMVVADENCPLFVADGFCGLPQQMAVLERLPESFKTGIGLNYDALGPEGNRGCRIADVGCSAGVALVEMAKAFPRSTFHGYDIAKIPLARALENAAQAGLRNIAFHDATVDALPGDASFDFITSFDCLHDMTRPDLVMRGIRAAIKPDGTWLIADVHRATFDQNPKDNPLAPFLYSISVLCCMSSALSEPGGLGLGTLGFPEAVARKMTAEAGFTRFATHDFENPINAYYEVRP
jgi:2-polyprenyl-3-methyl-5-hydroxy-6-metoxy-1,4-benzoquinol methylase